MTPFAASFALNPSGECGDGYASWSLNENTWLGVIVDAPSSAASGSNGIAIEAIESYLNSRNKQRLVGIADAGGGNDILWDLLETVSRKLEIHSQRGWVAISLALIDAESVSVIGCGDCACYLAFHQEATIRLCDSSRIEGCVIPPADSSLLEAAHLGEGIYLGGTSGVPASTFIRSFKRKKTIRLLLTTDGVEDQLGVSYLLAEIHGNEFSKEALVKQIHSTPLKDDTTFLGVDLNVEPEKQPNKQVLVEDSPEPELQPAGSAAVPSARKWIATLLVLLGLALLAFIVLKIHESYEGKLWNLPNENKNIENSPE